MKTILVWLTIKGVPLMTGIPIYFESEKACHIYASLANKAFNENGDGARAICIPQFK